jgi:16S rRNA (uracil1498-N3)-methyltransferase
MVDGPRRLFAPQLSEAGGELKLPAESVQHVRVLRLGPGTRVELFDARSGRAEATLTSVTRDVVVCKAGPRQPLPNAARGLHVVLGLPKGGKLEDIARMLTELGASSLHVALCERSVPRPKSASARMTRLQRIAREACAQSGQPRAPELHPPRPLLEIAESAPVSAHRLVFWERADTPLPEALPSTVGSEVWAVIGPEGGLDEREVDALLALGFVAVGLGPALLRVETASVVIAALLLERLGRLRD